MGGKFNKKKRKILFYIILLVSILVYTINIIVKIRANCNFFTGCEGFDERLIRDNVYTFDSSLILDEIIHGKEDLFQYYPGEYELTQERLKPVSWSEEDFLNVKNEISKQIWGETNENWSLNDLVAINDCENIAYGIQTAHFEYFRDDSLNNDRYIRSITIRAEYGVIHIVEKRLLHIDEPYIKLDNTHILSTAMAVIEITEQHVGKKFREDSNNRCSVWVSDFTEDPGWIQVSYLGDYFSYNKVMKLKVNPELWEWEVLSTGPIFE